MERGASLAELVLVLLLSGALLGLLWPGVTGMRDGLGVLQAREEVMAIFLRARTEAVARGGVTVLVVPGEDRLFILEGSRVLGEADLRPLRVDLTVPGSSASSVQLRYDGMGVGRVASRTLRLSRGGAEGAVVVSSFGRVSRR